MRPKYTASWVPVGRRVATARKVLRRDVLSDCPLGAASNLARYDGADYGHREGGREPGGHLCRLAAEGFGDEVKRRIMLGNYALSAGYYDAYYLKALKVRRLIRREFDLAFQECDYCYRR